MTGSCWVKQCMVPSPQTRSTAWIPTTARSVNSSANRPRALRSFGSLNVGTSTAARSEEHTSELQSRLHLVCRLLLEKKKKKTVIIIGIDENELEHADIQRTL